MKQPKNMIAKFSSHTIILYLLYYEMIKKILSKSNLKYFFTQNHETDMLLSKMDIHCVVRKKS